MKLYASRNLQQYFIVDPLYRMMSAMKTQTFENIVVSPPAHIQPKSSIIWLHGLGADGHDFVPIVKELQLPEALGVRFVFPHAPVRPVTLKGGAQMPAWFDICDLRFEGHNPDEEGLAKAHQKLTTLIEQETALGIPSDKIILAGFSQGGALALYSGLHYQGKLGGVIALSTYFPTAKVNLALLTPSRNTLPIFMAHGTFDPVVPLRHGKKSREQLSELGLSIDWRTYAMMHTVCAKEVRDISVWLREIIDN
jgi:phospholipase/carboxylesterase